jgi:1-acyl-sn-glycerol-3-phosphate acyltransferase
MGPARAQAKTVLSWAGIIWLNVSFWIVFTLWTFVLAFVAIPYQYLFHWVLRNQRRSDWLIRRMISKYGAAVIRSGWPLARAQFVDCAPDDKPPFVFVANHRSASDAFLMSFLPLECVQMLNIWPSRMPLINYLSRTAGYLRVREMPFEEFVEAGTRLLSQGVSIIAFPEGTVSRLGISTGPARRSEDLPDGDFRQREHAQTRLAAHAPGAHRGDQAAGAYRRTVQGDESLRPEDARARDHL